MTDHAEEFYPNTCAVAYILFHLLINKYLIQNNENYSINYYIYVAQPKYLL